MNCNEAELELLLCLRLLKIKIFFCASSKNVTEDEHQIKI